MESQQASEQQPKKRNSSPRINTLSDAKIKYSKKIKDELVVVDKDTGAEIPIKLALGKKHIKIENSLLYSVMLFGTLSDDQINKYMKTTGKDISQNDKIAHYLYRQASNQDREAINALLELNLAIAKRDKTTIVNFGETKTETGESVSETIINKLEKELADITEAETIENTEDKKLLADETE